MAGLTREEAIKALVDGAQVTCMRSWAFPWRYRSGRFEQRMQHGVWVEMSTAGMALDGYKLMKDKPTVDVERWRFVMQGEDLWITKEHYTEEEVKKLAATVLHRIDSTLEVTREVQKDTQEGV